MPPSLKADRSPKVDQCLPIRQCMIDGCPKQPRPSFQPSGDQHTSSDDLARSETPYPCPCGNGSPRSESQVPPQAMQGTAQNGGVLVHS
jgi:hypothetical protein